MPGDYEKLASVYTDLAMGSLGRSLAPRLVDFAQRHDWMGRRILDVGCGDGASLEWLVGHGYIVTGLDNSPPMLALAQQNASSERMSGVRWLEHDLLSLQNTDVSQIDLVICINVINELDSLKDLETAFRSMYHVLGPGKMVIMDMLSIQGLYEQTVRDRIVLERDNLFIMTNSAFDFDRQSRTTRYTIFQKEGAAWNRQEASLILRAYPVQAVASLLQRSGFNIKHLLSSTLDRYDPSTTPERVVIMAEKQ